MSVLIHATDIKCYIAIASTGDCKYTEFKDFGTCELHKITASECCKDCYYLTFENYRNCTTTQIALISLILVHLLAHCLTPGDEGGTESPSLQNLVNTAVFRPAADSSYTLYTDDGEIILFSTEVQVTGLQ